MQVQARDADVQHPVLGDGGGDPLLHELLGDHRVPQLLLRSRDNGDWRERGQQPAGCAGARVTTTSVPTSTDALLENRKLSAATSSTHYNASFVSSRQGRLVWMRARILALALEDNLSRMND